MTGRIPAGLGGAARSAARELPQRLSSLGNRLRAGRGSLVLGAGVVLPRATGFLTLPIYTRLLGPEDFGRYELLISTLALLYASCLVGLDFAIAVRYFGQGEDGRRRDLASAVAAAAGASIISALVLLGLAGVIGPAVLRSSDGGLPFAIAVAAVPFNVVGGVLAMYLRLRFDAKAFFRAMVIGAVGGSATGVILVVVASWGLLGAITGFAAVQIITFALLAWSVRSLYDRGSADRKTLIRLIRLGAPLVPAGAASWIFALADRFFLAAFLGFVQLGLYASAARLATVLAMIQFGFHAAWGPLALRWGFVVDRDRRYASSLRLVAVAGGAAVALIAWLAEPLLWVLAGPSYVAASGVVWALAGGVLFSAMFFVVQIGANIAQRAGRVAWAVAIAALVNTVANLALIPVIGYLGAGIATLTAYFVAYVVMYAMSQTATPIRMAFGRSTLWAIVWTTIAGASVVVPASARVAATVIVVSAAIVIAVAAVIEAGAVIGSPITDGPLRGQSDGAAQGGVDT